MSRAPEISVLVPCWNDGRSLDDALASVAAQSFGDFEVVISDDGSADDSVAIAEAWSARDSRFRSLGRQQHLGMTENWNRALAAARGDRLAKLDADDLWHERTLEELSAAFAGTPDLLAAFCRVEVDDGGARATALWPGETALGVAGFPPGSAHVAPGRAFWLASLGDAQLWHSNAFLVPKAELERFGGFDARWSCAADTALQLRLAAENRQLAHRPYVGVVYRRRAGSVSAEGERAGWKALEGQLVRLDALERDAGRLAPLPRAARQAWWQAWRNLGATRSAVHAPGLDAATRAKLARALAAATPPPLAVRAEGFLRLQGWRLRARLAGASAARSAA